jgi:hypothetical protein
VTAGAMKKVDYFGASAGAAGSFFIAMGWWWCTT